MKRSIDKLMAKEAKVLNLKRYGWLWAILAFMTITACSSNGGDPTPTPTVPSGTQPGTATPIQSDAKVESIEILILESFPVQVMVVARGNLPDGCTQIDQITEKLEGLTFFVTLHTSRDPGASCIEALVPFEERISLDVLGLEAGRYTVNVNGVSDHFELAVDNVAPDISHSAAISGLVWDDGPGDAQGNGILEDGEGRIANVLISLGEGQCPASQVLTTETTDVNGTYTFAELGAGVYCVFVDLADEQNLSTLGSGNWTSPGAGIGEATVILENGQIKSNTNFGWDF